MEGRLPEGWVSTPLQEVVGTFESIDPRTAPSEQFRYIDIGTINNKTHQVEEAKSFVGREAPSRARRVVRTNDVLFSTVRPYLKNIASVPEHLDGELTSTGICILRPTSAVDPRFLLQSVLRQEFVGAISAAMDGTMYPAVRDADVLAQSIPLPPLNEQRRIVARLEELTARTNAARAALEAIPPLLDRFRQSVLAAAFRGDLTADWRAKNPDVEPASELLKRIRVERRRRWEEAELEKMRAKGKVPGDDRWKAKYVEPEGVDAESLPELPEGWVWATVGELTSEPLRTGVSIRGSDAPPGTPSLKLSAIRSRQVDYSMVKYVQASPEVATENCVRDGDVFIARGNGSINLVGRCAQAVEPPELTIFPDLMIRVRCVSQMPAALFTILWDSPETRRIIEQKAKTTAGIWKVSQSDLARIPLPVPSYQEAEALVERVEDMLSSAKKESTATETATKMLTTLHQSLLSKAFRGELVPQDPDDEPASVLLERIRNQREAAGGNGKSKRGRKAKQS